MTSEISRETANEILAVIIKHTDDLSALLQRMMNETPVEEHSNLKLLIGHIFSEYGDRLGDLIERTHPDIWNNYLAGGSARPN